MIKLTFCLRRRPELTREEFQDYWRTTHGPLVQERATELGIARYVQVHTLTDVDGLHEALVARNGGAPEPYDGIAEIWVDSVDTFANVGWPGAKAAAELLADEANFIDLANSPMFLGVEIPLVG